MDSQVRKNFLQACINHSNLSKEQIHNILGPICEAYDVEEPFDDELKTFVNDINKTLTPLNQSLTFVKHPLIGEERLVFCLTSEAGMSKRQPHYTEVERYYFGVLLEKIVQQSNYGIAWPDIFAFVDPNKKITKTRLQDLIIIWMNQGYFMEKDCLIYFGPRVLAEFGNYLKNNFGELVQDCPLCNKLVLWDLQCRSCDARVHRECIRKYLSRMSTCPSCNEKWETPLNDSN